MGRRFKTGMEMLLSRHARWLAGARVGLVSHMAAVNAGGFLSVDLLCMHKRCRLTALFGPEHGFIGGASAGEHVGHTRHSRWGIPLYSLYGKRRRPTSAMLRRVDVLVVDLQDLGARPYTYVATLRYVMEAAAAAGKSVIVADRPIPLPRIVDGAAADPALESFVNAVPAPMAYGMTPAETALWLKSKLKLDLDLRVVPMTGYQRQAGRDADWPPWIPPSPGIRAWETARCYLATVFSEALPAVDIGRGTNLAFQVFGAPFMRSRPVLDWLNNQRLPGVNFHAHQYFSAAGRLLDGVRLTVCDPHRFRPVTTSLVIVECLQSLCGPRKIWRHPQTRPAFLDQLYGTSQVRIGLQSGVGWREISAGWRSKLRRFNSERRGFLLY